MGDVILMADGLQDAFDEIIPGAADKAGLFLRVILDRAVQEDIGLTFVAKNMRKTKQPVLEATIKLAGNAFLVGAPMKLIVHSDPIGSSLQVGWQLTTEELGSIMKWSESAQAVQNSKHLRNMKPEHQRKLSGIVQAFHLSTFNPVLQMLVQAVESSSRPEGGGGFLGA